MLLICKILKKVKFHWNKETLKIPFYTFLSLFDADLLLIWMNKFRHGFRFRSASCPVLHIVLIISRGECSCLRQICSSLNDLFGLRVMLPIIFFFADKVFPVIPLLEKSIIAKI